MLSDNILIPPSHQSSLELSIIHYRRYVLTMEFALVRLHILKIPTKLTINTCMILLTV